MRAGSVCQFIVLRSIQLDHQPRSFAVEIDNVGWQWVLSAKLEPIKLTTPKAQPQFAFSVSRLATKSACAGEGGCGQRWFDHRRSPNPHPNPSPGGRGTSIK